MTRHSVLNLAALPVVFIHFWINLPVLRGPHWHSKHFLAIQGIFLTVAKLPLVEKLLRAVIRIFCDYSEMSGLEELKESWMTTLR